MKSVFNHVLCPFAAPNFGDKCPFFAFLEDLLDKLDVFIMGPWLFGNVGVQMIDPMLPNLLWISEVESTRPKVKVQRSLIPFESRLSRCQ